MVKQALAGIRVVELATGVAGPYCGKLLAGLGAEVTKVEPPEGDETRREGPFPGDVPHPERSGLFLHLNTRKRGMVLDLSGEEGRAALGEVISGLGADVLILSHKPSALASLGIHLEDLRARFPRLVIVDITTFGLFGPYAEFKGGELIAYAASGYMNLTGDPNRKPIKAYGSLIHYQAGVHAAVGALAALFAREATGEGQIVDVSVTEAGTFLLGGVEQVAYFYGRIERRNGTRLLGFSREHSYPSTIRPCKDGFVHCHSNNRYPDLLGALIPHPRLLDPELLSAMMGHADEIDEIMDEWLRDKERKEVVRRAQELRLPFTEVMTPGEVLEDQHHKERGSFVTIDHPGSGPVTQPGAPFRMHGTPWMVGPAPMLGQQTDEILREVRTSRPESGTGHQPTSFAKDARSRRPLDGVRVLDFTTAVAGPIATAILADLGADVIKVEAPFSRPLRASGTAPPREGGDDKSYNRMMLFNQLNHGKRGISLDVSRPEGREIFLRLAAKSDVVVENFAPRVLGNLGVDYGQLRQAREDIILVSMPAFGLTGPYRDRTSYGPGIDAMSGLSHLTGYPDGPPMKPGNFFCDQNAGVHAAFATMAALWHRRKTGEGQHVELPMIEGEFQILGDAYIDFSMNHRERIRAGNAHQEMAPHDVYPCEGDDAWVAIAVEDDIQWTALCRAMGREDLISDPRFSTAQGRRRHLVELDECIRAWTTMLTPRAVQETLQRAGVPAAAVLNAKELLEDPHVRARNGFEYVDVPNVGPTPHPRVAFLLSETPVPIARPAPGFAEHNDDVYGDLIGLSSDEIRALEQKGIIASTPSAG